MERSSVDKAHVCRVTSINPRNASLVNAPSIQSIRHFSSFHRFPAQEFQSNLGVCKSCLQLFQHQCFKISQRRRPFKELPKTAGEGSYGVVRIGINNCHGTEHVNVRCTEQCHIIFVISSSTCVESGPRSVPAIGKVMQKCRAGGTKNGRGCGFQYGSRLKKRIQ